MQALPKPSRHNIPQGIYPNPRPYDDDLIQTVQADLTFQHASVTGLRIYSLLSRWNSYLVPVSSLKELETRYGRRGRLAELSLPGVGR